MQKLKLTKKYAKYSGYKDSGADWLGSIPQGWEAMKLRHLFEIKKRIVGNIGADVLSITQRGIKVKNIETNSGQISADYSKYQIVEKGDFAMNHMDLLTGYVDISPYTGVISPDYRVFSLRNKSFSDKYFLYLMQIGYLQKIFYAYGRGAAQFGRWRFPSSEFKSFMFPVPLLEEQEKIVKLLDKKIALIDQIIKKKQKQIQHLKEKRTAVINHVMTKGFDPSVELVDSGMDWIGKIPKGWQINRIKFVAEVIPSNVDKLVVEGETSVRLCNYTDVYKNDTITSGMTDGLMIASATKKQIEKLTLRQDDVIITKDSETPDDIGVPAYVPEDLFDVVCGYHLAIIRPHKIHGGYLARFFLTQGAKTQFFLSANGLTRYAIGIGDIGGAYLPIPPIGTQIQIAEYLDEKKEGLNVAIKYIERSIGFLQELKSSIISNAVTGKIKI